MAAISSTQHEDFCNQILQMSEPFGHNQVIPAHRQESELIKENVVLMESMFAEYNKRVRELYALIADYDELKKQTRVQMRKLMNDARRNGKGRKTMFKLIKEAS